MLDAGVPVCVVLSDRPCRGLEVAERAGVPTELVDRRAWGGFGPGFDRRAFTETVTGALRAHDPDLLAMAGFGTVLDEPVHAAFPGRVLNTHPALLPAFPGWHGVEDALAAGVRVTGCTVHVATLEMDAGPILAQEAVAVRPDDTVETLHERIKEAERQLYPRHHPASARRAGRHREPGTALSGGTYVRALLSVYEKTGLVDLATGLSDLGWELVASGNTSAALAEAGIAHAQVAEVTGSPEMLGGPGSRPCTPASTAGSWPTGRCPGTWRTWRPRASIRSTWSSATCTPSPRTPRSSSSTSAVPPWCGRRPRTLPTSGW